VRDPPAAGEKPVVWVGSSKRALLRFPARVVRDIGAALSVAQYGGIDPAAKVWKGQGPGVLEIVEDFDRATYRGGLHRTLHVCYLPPALLSEEVTKRCSYLQARR
jgi:phage-related protein